MSAVLEALEPSARYLEAAQPTLVRQFELLAMAPGGVARLRKLILVLAVQGKLTRRDALAEPAPALLARILKQKESLIAAGKIKRDKPLPAIDEADPPFDIPQSWCWIRLGGVTNYGSPTKGESIGPETWVLDLEDIEKSTGRLLHRVRRSERPSLSEKNSFQAGDVLYGKLRPYLNKVIVADEPGVCTTELVPFRCYGDWVPQYFKTALSSPAFLEYVNARSYGMKMPRLGTEVARSALLPLPPLEEQARIVARVDELMRLCDALEGKGRLEAEQHARLLGTLLGTLTDSSTPEELAANWQRVADHFDLLLDRPEAVDALEQTILQLAVRGLLVRQDPSHEPADLWVRRMNSNRVHRRAAAAMPTLAETDRPDLPAGWCVTNVGSIAECLDYIRRPIKKTDREASGGSVPYYGANGQVGRINEHLFDEDLVLVVEDETFIGRTKPFSYVVRGKSWVNNHAHVLRPLGGLSADFLNLCLERYDFIPLTSGTTNRRKLTQPGLLNAEFMIGPLEEQVRILARVTELRRLCAELRQRLTASQSTKSHLAEALVDEVA